MICCLQWICSVTYVWTIPTYCTFKQESLFLTLKITVWQNKPNSVSMYLLFPGFYMHAWSLISLCIYWKYGNTSTEKHKSTLRCCPSPLAFPLVCCQRTMRDHVKISVHYGIRGYLYFLHIIKSWQKWRTRRKPVQHQLKQELNLFVGWKAQTASHKTHIYCVQGWCVAEMGFDGSLLKQKKTNPEAIYKVQKPHSLPSQQPLSLISWFSARSHSELWDWRHQRA